MRKVYLVKWALSTSVNIAEVDLIKETKCFYVLDSGRVSKEGSSYQNVFETIEQAKKFIYESNEAKIESGRNRFQYSVDTFEEIKKKIEDL